MIIRGRGRGRSFPFREVLDPGVPLAEAVLPVLPAVITRPLVSQNSSQICKKINIIPEGGREEEDRGGGTEGKRCVLLLPIN